MTSLQYKVAPARCAAVIPAFNEALKIADVVRGVVQFAVPIVVDDGSTDGTAQVAMAAGAIVIRHVRNLGYDAALQTGLFKAIELGFDYGITLDADGQHAPHTLSAFIGLLNAGADLVIGRREHSQRFAEAVFALMGRCLWRIDDPLCGMKGYKLTYLERLGHFDAYRSIGTEFAIRAARTGLIIVNVPIPTAPRQGESRFGTGWRPNLKILRALCYGLYSAGRLVR
jgi:glycosyltransferase involved in cell wall biosynthesis